MAVTQIYTAIPNDVITAARWNNEFGNIYNNGTDISFPVTKAVSFAGFTITLDASGATTLSSSSATGFLLTPGSKSGAPSTTGKVVNIAASTITDTSTAGSGTATAQVANAIQRPTFAATNSSVTTTDAASLYIANAPAAGTNMTLTNPWAIWVDDGAVRFDGALRVDGLATLASITTTGALIGNLVPGWHRAGLLFSNNAGDATNDIDIAVGECANSTTTASSRVLMRITTALTKRLDASWVTGTNQGGLSSSLTIGNNPYYVFVIRVAGVDDVGFDTSEVAANLITDHGATHFRRIGWIQRTGGTIVPFTTHANGGGYDYHWTTLTLDVNLANTLTTTRRTDAARVPLNISTMAHLYVMVDDATQTNGAIIQCPDHADQTPSETAAPLHNAGIEVAAANPSYDIRVRTSAAGLVAAKASVATMNTYAFCTVGFHDFCRS